MNKTNRDWQPISTAPEDGTVVLIYEGPGKDGIITTAYLAPHNRVCIRGTGWKNDGRERDWELAACGTHADDARCYPTHWMPLPEPPKMERDDE